MKDNDYNALTDEDFAKQVQLNEQILTEQQDRSEVIKVEIIDLKRKLAELDAEYRLLNGSMGRPGEIRRSQGLVKKLQMAVKLRQHPFPVWSDNKKSYFRILKVTPKRIYLQDPMDAEHFYWDKKTGESNNQHGVLDVKKTLAVWDAFDSSQP